MSIDAEKATALRKPFPRESIGQLPKGGVMLDYVGHAAVTDRLLTVDPEWAWDFALHRADGTPVLNDGDGNLWIKLTVCGVTRLGVGDGKNAKERIGDAIRNAAMRFGVALDLWAKENLVEFAQAAQAHRAPPRPTPVPSDSREPLMLDTKSSLARAMYAAINGAGVPESERLVWVSNVIGRDIDSTKEMTEDEARLVLDHLAAQDGA